ncbi:MAG: hypothetical protein Q8Q31_05365 [Nanoarchaeota archaeon]|nr:hypothetical protein [Nanoarchaeota archaeon]
MVRISNGKIRLEDKIIDLTEFQVRNKTTEQDLERHYDSFIGHAPEIRDYFEEREAFNEVLDNAARGKRPKLIARETKYPFLWAFRSGYRPLLFLKPSERRLNDDYFMTPHCITAVPIRKQPTMIVQEDREPVDEALREDIRKKFEKYPGYEGILEIPDDRSQPLTKAIVFHEGLHYLIARYQAYTGRKFLDITKKHNFSGTEIYQAEHAIHEKVVEIFTDQLLNHDPDAQFEERWSFYDSSNGISHSIRLSSAIGVGMLLGSSLSQPSLLPLALIPGRIRDYALMKYKQSKRKELLSFKGKPEFSFKF